MLKRINERTWKQLAALDNDSVRLVLPISSLEQHATHLPIGTDDFISTIGMDSILENPALKPDFWLLPAIHYGISFEHMGFTGTFSLSPATLITIVEDILNCMRVHGWKTLVLINSHGGNQGVLRGMAQTWRYRFGVKIYYIELLNSARACFKNLLNLPSERDGHAGEAETSVLMCGKPNVVDLEAWEQQADMTNPLPNYLESWMTAELSATGLLGGASLASPEKGEKLIAAMGSSLIQILDSIAHA